MVDINWLGHDGFQIKAKNRVIYIDPYDIPEGLAAADLIFLTHHHYDHCSRTDVEKISTPKTLIVANKKTLDTLGRGEYQMQAVGVKKEPVDIRGVSLKAIPAYNTDKHFHPKEDEGLGFLITVDKTSIYHAGDTDRIPEMDGLQCDYALVPVSGTYVMSITEAVAAAERIDAKTFIPMHYGKIVGHANMGKEFKQLCKKHVEVKEVYQG